MATPEQIRQWRAEQYNATAVFIRKSHDDLAVLRVKPDFVIPEHRAGQYTTLGLGAWEPRREDAQEEVITPANEGQLIRRAYSISHPILDDQGRLVPAGQGSTLEFYVALLKNTDTEKPPRLTPRLYLLQEGERLFVGDKITGHFNLDGVKADDTVVFLSTGTGEAPHNFMSWELLVNGHRGVIVFVSCVRILSDLAYRETHQRLEKMFTNFRYVPLTTREANPTGRKVYIQDAIESGELERQARFTLAPATTHVFLCGNPKMIGVPIVDRASGTQTYPQPKGAIEVLERRGFRGNLPQLKQEGNIHFEQYW
jgi:ferredoxin/flavodoxin---NADP+ reductase